MSKYERSVNYRSNFIKHNKGVFNSNIYHCSYCGKLLNIKKMKVDHLIPIHRVKHIGIGRLLMRIKGIKDINDIQNLVPSCERCNTKKSAKMGFWIIRGEIGRHFFFWILWWSFLLASATIIGYTYRDIIFELIKSIFEYFF